MSVNKYKGKRIIVTIPWGTWEIIEKNLKGKIGDKDAEIIRNIVITWLSEKSFIKRAVEESKQE